MNPSPPTLKTLNQCLEEFIRSSRAMGLSPYTCLEYERRLRTFTWPTLTPQSFERYAAWLAKQEMGNSRRNDYLKTLRTFGNWLVRHEYIKTNPVKMMGWKQTKPNRPVMTWADVEKIRAHLATIRDREKAQAWNYAMVVAWHTGLRLADVCQLQWSSVNPQTRVLTVIPQKTKRHGLKLEIPYGDELAATLSALAGIHHEFVCPYLGESYRTDTTLSMEFRRLSWAAGVRPKKGMHSFRHAMVTRLLEKHMSPDMIGSVTGQSAAVIRSYGHIGIDSKKAMLGIV